jgi:gas vesicle protein
MTVTETKKPIFKLIREYFDKLAEAWFVIFLFFALYFHIEMLKLFPLSPKAVHTWLASFYQIIGAVCVLIQINKSLKILRKFDFLEKAKQYLVTWPKRTARYIILHGSSAISFSDSVSGVVIKKNRTETLEEKIEHLSKRIDEIDKKIDANQKNLTEKFKKDKEKIDKQISTMRKDISTLNVNLEDTVIGDYKKALFGILMIIYGICIPVVGLYT